MIDGKPARVLGVHEPRLPGDYVLFATLHYATVLPAVLSTTEWLETAPRSAAGLDRYLVLKVGRPTPRAAAALVRLPLCSAKSLRRPTNSASVILG